MVVRAGIGGRTRSGDPRVLELFLLDRRMILTQLKSVVLPAPLGPMSPTI